MDQTLPKLLKRIAEENPDVASHYSKNENEEFIPTLYKDYYQNALNFGAGLLSIGAKRGDHIGLICDNNLYVKVTEPGRAVLKEVVLRPPYDGAKDYFYISDVDDRDYLAELITATIPALPKPKAKKNPLK